MKNAEKFRKIFKEFATEVWAFPEKDFLTWLNAEYKEPTTKNDSSELEKNSKKLEKGTTKNNLGVEEVTALAEWTEKLTKASEDAYNKGFADGANEVLDKLRAEIEDIDEPNYDFEGFYTCQSEVLQIIDKYKTDRSMEDGNDD